MVFTTCLPCARAERSVLSSDLRDPSARAGQAGRQRQREDARLAKARLRGRLLGLPLREIRADGGARELMAFKGDQPLYYSTCNANAGISSGANLLWGAVYGVDGGTGTIGLWDGSSARTTHREFGGRVVGMDGAGLTYDHSTHVAGTLCAAGIEALAKGMAPGARVDSYDWTSDISEMLERGAAYPGETVNGSNTFCVSSHSYGYSAGWYKTGTTPSYIWYGSGRTASGVEDDFGNYLSYAGDLDALACGLPYYLPFWAAGNDRIDNPAPGNSVYLSPSETTVLSYNPASHPPGDGTYRGGYDTISFHALAKNIVTLGAVKDAVSSDGARSLSGATMTTFSSWGPADDGRIKPDLVANGQSLLSTSSTADDATNRMSGTSMATPSAAGTAHLLVHLFGKCFTNQFMRASTLKALLIHTADDLGNPGPDYQYGWGLINATNAAALLTAYATNAGTRLVTEDHIATNRTAVSVPFAWDGSSPIRATLCWTDPPCTNETPGDARTPHLVNNLDLRVTGPSGTVYEPWVMPFVGDWSTNAYAAAATAGSNRTDNVEQVLVASPGTAGTYTARVTFAGTLTRGDQPFSLLLSGVSSNAAAVTPQLTSVTSPGGRTGTRLITLSGDALLLGGIVRLTKSGEPPVLGTGLQAFGDTALARIAVTGLAAGTWDVTYTNPGGQEAVAANAFAVPPDKATVLHVR